MPVIPLKTVRRALVRLGEVYMRESMNSNNAKFYIDGAWVSPAVPKSFDLVNPATEEPIGAISLGSAQDVDRAVVAARKAFATYSQTSKQQRLTFSAADHRFLQSAVRRHRRCHYQGDGIAALVFQKGPGSDRARPF